MVFMPRTHQEPRRSHRRTFFLPDQRKVHKAGLPWDHTYSMKQNFVPKDPALNKKLGIAQGEEVLVIAGCYGNFANEIARGVRGAVVHYTDLSRSMVEGVRREKRDISSYRARDALLIPRKPNQYHWSFSFEPLQLQNRSFPIFLVRSLLNRKGAIVVWGKELNNAHHMKKVAEIYGALFETKEEQIEGDYQTFPRKHPDERLVVNRLLTTAEARRKAHQDLRVLQLVDRTSHIDLNALGKKLNITKEQIIESLERLSNISTMLYSDVLTQRSVKN